MKFKIEKSRLLDKQMAESIDFFQYFVFLFDCVYIK